MNWGLPAGALTILPAAPKHAPYNAIHRLENDMGSAETRSPKGPWSGEAAAHPQTTRQGQFFWAFGQAWHGMVNAAGDASGLRRGPPDDANGRSENRRQAGVLPPAMTNWVSRSSGNSASSLAAAAAASASRSAPHSTGSARRHSAR